MKQKHWLASIPGRHTLTIIYIACQYAALLILIACFKIAVIPPGPLSLAANFISSSADALIILSITLLLRYLWRPLAALPILIVSLVIFAEIIYQRNFADCIPPGLFHLKGNMVNDFVIDGVIASFSFADLIWLLPLIFSICIDCFCRRLKIGWHATACTVVSAVIFLTVSTLLGIRRSGIYAGSTSFAQSRAKYKEDWLYQTHWTHKVTNFGTTGYFAKVIHSMFAGNSVSVSPQQLDSLISDLTSRSHRQLRARYLIPIPDNTDKNLIFIEVESLSSTLFSLPYADAVAPTLCRLVSDSTAIVCTDMEVIAGLGRSSDAQFTHNTGLLPVRSEITVNEFPVADYPSLAKSLPDSYISIEFICEGRELWSHALTTRSYGFDCLIDNLAPRGLDQDSILMNFAARHLTEISQPFYAFISTISSHDPYFDSNVSVPADVSSAIPDSLKLNDRNYLYRIAHFDRSLSRFLFDLHDKAILEKSIVIITGDHEPRRINISPLFHSSKVPFIVANAGAGIDCNGLNATQADIFPTILDIFHIQGHINLAGRPTPWQGYGKSLLRNLPRTTTHESDWQQSELIIRAHLCSDQN